jgi:hypothetical protein
MAAPPDTILAHWSTLYPGLQEAPREFYRRVEAAVLQRQIPELKMELIEYREGGAFSGFREYFRIRRRREVFDVCGAPFGNGFFFSWWLAEVKPSMPSLAKIVIVLVYLVLLGAAAEKFGFVRGPIIVIVLLSILLAIGSHAGTADFDDLILVLPLIGPLYERFFRPITYYRIDTSQMFQKAVEQAVQEAVDQVTVGRGLRPLTEFERKPVMRDFFKR